MEQKFNMGNSQKTTIETKQIKIAQNVFIYNNTFIPLHSISQVSVFQEQKKEYPKKTIYALGIGFILILLKGIFILIGLAVMAVAAFLLYNVYKYNKEEIGEYLKIEINTGKNIYLYDKNRDFLIEIMDVMINCINTQGEYLISMDTYNIEACQFGDHNLMTNEEKKNE